MTKLGHLFSMLFLKHLNEKRRWIVLISIDTPVNKRSGFMKSNSKRFRLDTSSSHSWMKSFLLVLFKVQSSSSSIIHIARAMTLWYQIFSPISVKYNQPIQYIYVKYTTRFNIADRANNIIPFNRLCQNLDKSFWDFVGKTSFAS